MAYMPSKEH